MKMTIKLITRTCEISDKSDLAVKNTISNLLKHYNDLLDRRSSGRARDEITYFYVGDVFRIYLGS